MRPPDHHNLLRKFTKITITINNFRESTDDEEEIRYMIKWWDFAMDLCGIILASTSFMEIMIQFLCQRFQWKSRSGCTPSCIWTPVGAAKIHTNKNEANFCYISLGISQRCFIKPASAALKVNEYCSVLPNSTRQLAVQTTADTVSRIKVMTRWPQRWFQILEH